MRVGFWITGSRDTADGGALGFGTSMLSWLHVSDFHFKSGDPYDRDVVLGALVRSVAEFRARGRRPDLIFATGDVAHSGKPAEYTVASQFFDALLAAAGLDKRRLFVIPGNHDVDRDLGVGLARSLQSREEADAYFGPNLPKVHLLQKQGEFVRWYNAYFAGVRCHPDGSTCGPVEAIVANGVKVGVLPVNSALFCQGDDDHARLWIGRRCLGAGLEELEQLNAVLNVALVHHPLDWLHNAEGANIRTSLQTGVDVILRGHLHRTDVEAVAGVMGEALHMAAGAAYQTRQWPNRALYGTFSDGRISVFPIRYEDEPREIWTVDPSVFPSEPDYTRVFALARHAAAASVLITAVAPLPAQPSRPTRFRSNIPSRRNLPFVGRDDLLNTIGMAFADRSREAVVVLHGQPGVGKSELAREFGRRNSDAYPGGRFVVEAGKQAIAVDLARLGNSLLDLDLPTDSPLQDQGLATLATLGSEPTLLIFDNVVSQDSVVPWLPPAGMRCHVLLTTNLDRWDAGWLAFPVPPLLRSDSLELVERIAGPEVCTQFGERLVQLADGLPVQLVPASATLAYEARRGRLGTATLTLSEEAQTSFLGVYEQLEAPARLLLHAATRLNAQRLPVEELRHHMAEGAGWSSGEFQRRLDAALDLHLLQGESELRVHQLLVSFMNMRVLVGEVAETLRTIVTVQAKRLVEIATNIGANPNRPDLASLLLIFPSNPQNWGDELAVFSTVDGEIVGRALYEIGRFEIARLWFERAVKEKERGDIHGRVDHESLGRSVYQMGWCLSQLGQHEAARPWYERAVKEAEQGNIDGRVNHESLSRSVYQMGWCLLQLGQHDAARPWFKRAVEEVEEGDVYGRVDHEALGRSVHHVGWCLSQLGQHEAARPWYERAVREAEQGNIHGRVNHESLSRSLYQMGWCLLQLGLHEAAYPWFERAVKEAEQGDIHGRVDHGTLGRSVHHVGWCLSRLGQHEAALAWYERAVKEAEQGDIHGRVDHDILSISVHQVGNCLSQLGQQEAARPWYERAVKEAEQGDVHGRVKHESLGRSVHLVGWCLLRLEKYKEARPWFERAVREKELSDVHGRLDHESLGRSVHEVGWCQLELGQHEAARPWFERAVKEKELGDIHGRVDHDSLGKSLHALAGCCEEADELADAANLYQRAVNASELGDVHGQVDCVSLAVSQRAVGRCLSKLGYLDEAITWEERAVEAERRHGGPS